MMLFLLLRVVEETAAYLVALWWRFVAKKVMHLSNTFPVSTGSTYIIPCNYQYSIILLSYHFSSTCLHD